MGAKCLILIQELGSFLGSFQTPSLYFQQHGGFEPHFLTFFFVLVAFLSELPRNWVRSWVRSKRHSFIFNDMVASNLVF
jgi:hypothetical protein